MNDTRNIFLILLLATLTGCFWAAPTRKQNPAETERHIQKLMEAGTMALRQGTWESFERAQMAFELARDLAPNDARVLDGLGCVEWRRGHLGLATDFFNRAIALSPSYDRPYVHLALTEEQQGSKQRAQELLKTALKLNPMNFRARNNLAAMMLEAGYPHQSIKELLQAYNAGAQKDVVVLYNLNQAAESE